MTVVVAGAGIGGLTAALTLGAAGVDVTVLESAREVRPLGVGINLLPHAVRELTELGLGEDLAAIGVATREITYRDRFGAEVFTEPRGVAQGYRWPQYSVHRGELQLLLLRAVRERLGPDTVRAGQRVTGFEQADGVRVTLLDRTTDQVARSVGEALIGADGLHSTVRARLHPDDGPLLWSGVRMWRGVTDNAPLGTGRSMVIVRDGDVQLVAYPIGRNRTNWVCSVRVAEPRQLSERADWNRVGRAEEVLPYLRHWSLGWLDVSRLLMDSEQVFSYPMVDREPLPCWGRGAVTLLGDAAHPMYPVGANGASQAIVDAGVLARLLTDAGGIPAGLAAYEEERRDATAAVVRANRAMHRAEGQDAADLAHITASYRQDTGADVATLNARAGRRP